MTFRRDCLSFYETQTVVLVVVVLSVFLCLIVKTTVLLYFALAFLIALPVNSRLQNEYITIDETGIVCQKSGRTLWGHSWSEIAELRKCSRSRHLSIEIIVYSPGRTDPFQYSDEYFQLGWRAKKAIKQYYVPQNGDGSLFSRHQR